MDIKNVEEIYVLSPLQEDLLLNDLSSCDLGEYCGQWSCELRGVLNVAAFEGAWQQVIDCYSVLRTFFVWKRLDKPLQVVHKQLKLSLDKQDWRYLSPDHQQEHLEAFLQADREQGFDPSKAPLIRLTLCQTSEEAHQLICTYSRLVLDDLSCRLILKQVLACYEGFCQGQDWQPELKLPYRDYIAWFRRQDISKAKTFWRQMLEGFTVPTPLVVEQTPDSLSGQKKSYGKQQLKMSAAATANLHSLAGEHQLNLNTLLQGAWALLLGRYSSSEDVVFGTTVSGRPPELQGAESMVGPFINRQPVRVRVFPEAPVLSWLKELQTQQVDLSQYEYSSPIQVQEWSDLPNDQPLFKSIVVLDNYSMDSWQHLHFKSIFLSNIQTIGQINFPITITAQWNSELTLQITYDCHRFDGSTITRMLEQIKTLLEGMAAQPEQCLSRLPLLTGSVLRKLLVEWNETKTNYPQAQCIHQMFEAQAKRTPEAVAVVFEDKQLTYQALNCRANQLAHHLRSLGVEPEVLVGICMERSLEMIVGLLGILKAGGAYLPLDPAYPFERLSFTLEDAQPPVLLTQERLVEELPSHGAQVVCLDSDWEAISPSGMASLTAQESEENPSTEVTGQNLAYIIYTSGSTGTPKGVLVEHEGLYNLAEAQIRLFNVHSDSCVLQFASLSFDASISEVVMALCSGARLCLGSPESLFPGPELMHLLHNQAITHVTLPPSALAAMPLEALPVLQTIIVAGEPCSPRLAEQWSKGRRFFNAYGPSESTVCATVAEYTYCDKKPPIGHPIANTQIYILDRHLQPVPIDVPGELHIAGAGLARGYLNRPELTQEKFIPNPFSDEPGTRLYKTGDLARYLPNGNIEFLGRLDRQVKIRGFRIELAEIEFLLIAHPKIRDVVVIAREDQPGNKRLVAYIVPNQEQPLLSELQNFLRGKLPEFMVPSAFVMLEGLPLTPNGKVDRHALPAPDPSRRSLEADFVLPRNPTEEILTAIWAEVLGLEQVGIHDNFFEMGGDSILSIQVITRAHQAGLELSAKQLFQQQTIAELAVVAGRKLRQKAPQGIVTGPVPLTPIQHWFFEQNLAQAHHFNQSLMLEVPPELKPWLWQQIVAQLLVHHDALRLRFAPSESGWQQVNVAPETTTEFTVVDLSAMAAQEQKAHLESIAAAVQASLNLKQGPLMRAVLFDLGAGPGRLLLSVHHLAVDGVSWRILLEDMAVAYQQLQRGQSLQLPAKTTAFKEWAIQLRAYGQSEALAAQLDYWLGQWRPRVAPLPVDYECAKQDNTVASDAQVSVSLSVAQTRALLQEVPKAYNTQINDVLLTALVQSFAQWTGEPALLVDLEGHGREELFESLEVSRTVGWFTTLFPVRLELPPRDEPGAALKSVKEQLRRLPHRGMGYGVLRYLSREQATRLQLQALPAAEVSFNYLGQFDQLLTAATGWRLAKESTGPVHSPKGRRTHLLSVNGLVVGDRLQMDWTYSQNIHQRATVERLAFGFIQALQTLIAHCQSPEAGGYTPSDFSAARLSQKQLDKFIAKIKPTGRK